MIEIDIKIGAGCEPAEVKHFSKRRKRKQCLVFDETAEHAELTQNDAEFFLRISA